MSFDDRHKSKITGSFDISRKIKRNNNSKIIDSIGNAKQNSYSYLDILAKNRKDESYGPKWRKAKIREWQGRRIKVQFGIYFLIQIFNNIFLVIYPHLSKMHRQSVAKPFINFFLCCLVMHK